MDDPDRRHSRRQPAAERIEWRLPGSPDRIQGWLSDRSPEGLSFVAGSDYRPVIGEEILVTIRGERRSCCRVRRIARYDNHLSLIACVVTPLDDARDSASVLAERAYGTLGLRRAARRRS